MEDFERQGRPPSSFGERPALARLITATDIDDAAIEDSAEATGDDSAPPDAAAPTDAAPDDDQQQVNAEASATRLVNVERPSRLRHAHLYSATIYWQLSFVITTKFCTNSFGWKSFTSCLEINCSTWKKTQVIFKLQVFLWKSKKDVELPSYVVDARRVQESSRTLQPSCRPTTPDSSWPVHPFNLVLWSNGAKLCSVVCVVDKKS